VAVAEVAEISEDRPQTLEEIRAEIAEAKRKKDAAQLAKRDTKGRRDLENRQRNGRVNPTLLHGDIQSPGREERWTILARPDLIKQVKRLAKDLSAPRAKVSIAALMEEAIVDLLAKHQEQQEGA
jgi:endonuclease/exonuclease/phosphatase family metal-dependent hydrolase